MGHHRGWARGTFYLGRANQDLHVHHPSDRLHAFYDGPGTPVRRSWRSSDGLHWEQTLDSHPRGFHMALETGYLGLQWVPEPGAWWASRDGSTWKQMDLAGDRVDPLIDGARDPRVTPTSRLLSRDTAFIIVDDWAGNRDLWALRFDTPE